MAENKELEDLFIQPFSLPSVPQRFYFQFRAPITTSPTDLEDRSTCDAIYRKVRPCVMPRNAMLKAWHARVEQGSVCKIYTRVCGKVGARVLAVMPVNS